MASRQTTNTASSSGFQYAGNSAPSVAQLDLLYTLESNNPINGAVRTGAGAQAFQSPIIPILPVSNAVATPSAVYGSTGAAVGLSGISAVSTTVTVLTGSPIPQYVSTSTTATIANAGIAGYNGSFTVTSIDPSLCKFTFTGTSGLGLSGGGTVTFSGTTATASATVFTPALQKYIPALVGTTVRGSSVGPLEFWGDQSIWDTTNSRYIYQGIDYDAAWQDCNI